MAVSSDFESFLDELVDRNDIVDFISEYTKVKQVGNRFQALCPLHNDKKSPSLSISRDKQVFHCFGCGAGGTVIQFLMGMENLEFMDAVKVLADRANLTVPSSRNPRDKKKLAEINDKRKKIYEINSEAAKFFYKNLSSDIGKSTLDYLHNRKISNSTIKKFGLGYAPNGWTTLIEHLKTLGYTEREMFEAGLVKERENGTYFDAFTDRVMFPIIEVGGNIIGFGGRIMQKNDKVGKYLNTAETLVFKKKDNLFGINFAKNDKSGKILLMEGYMDVISLHQEGIGNAVASLGTAFTDAQAKLLKRYATKAVLCYDTDDAGKAATLRAGEILTANDIKTKVLTITDGKDPDEFVKAKGGDMFNVLVEGAKPLIEYKINDIKQQYNLEDTSDKIEFLENISAFFAGIKNPVEREAYIAKVSKEVGISEGAITAQVKALEVAQDVVRETREERTAKRLYASRVGERVELDKMALYNAEKLLMNLMCDKKVLLMVKKAEITFEDFSTDLHKKIAKAIFEIGRNGGNVGTNELLNAFEPDMAGNISAILVNDRFVEDKVRAANMPLKTMIEAKRKRLEENALENDDLEK
ncbi:MAG: DNA primase, partial [Oscillospiraceae bacterium]